MVGAGNIGLPLPPTVRMLIAMGYWRATGGDRRHRHELRLGMDAADGAKPDSVDGFLRNVTYLIHDRDPLFTEAFEATEPSGTRQRADRVLGGGERRWKGQPSGTARRPSQLLLPRGRVKWVRIGVEGARSSLGTRRGNAADADADAARVFAHDQRARLRGSSALESDVVQIQHTTTRNLEIRLLVLLSSKCDVEFTEAFEIYALRWIRRVDY